MHLFEAIVMEKMLFVKALLEHLLEERNMFPKLHAVMDVPHDVGIRSTLIIG